MLLFKQNWEAGGKDPKNWQQPTIPSVELLWLNNKQNGSQCEEHKVSSNTWAK